VLRYSYGSATCSKQVGARFCGTDAAARPAGISQTSSASFANPEAIAIPEGAVAPSPAGCGTSRQEGTAQTQGAARVLSQIVWISSAL
jgi:hypothetical protein